MHIVIGASIKFIKLPYCQIVKSLLFTWKISFGVLNLASLGTQGDEVRDRETFSGEQNWAMLHVIMLQGRNVTGWECCRVGVLQ